nr:type II toxin-antitoxin system RelE/ParE family toxin [Olsenella intestinalis]
MPLFWDDLERAVFYVRDVLKNPAAAKRLLDRTEAAILEHAKTPTMAQVYRTTRTRPQPYYWFAVGNYMVFYVVFEDVMEVRRFIYGARDLTKMLP